MKRHTVKSYDKDLNYLDELIDESIGFLLMMFELHAESLRNNSSSIQQKIHDIDNRVNELDKRIEMHAVVMLATRQPVAIDLRYIISVLRMSGIIERMGDISKHIVDRRERIEVQIPDDLIKDIDIMNDLISKMLKRVLNAYKTLDTKEALEIIADDKQIDEIYSNLMDRAAGSKGSLSLHLSSLMQFTISIKNIERLGDYIKKVAQVVYYIATGEVLDK